MDGSSTDWSQPFCYDEFISVHSNGGHIGRIAWCNQIYFTDSVRPPRFEAGTLPGDCRFIDTLGAWRWWLLDLPPSKTKNAVPGRHD